MDTESPVEQSSSGGRKTLVLSVLVGVAFAVGALGVTILVGGPDRGGALPAGGRPPGLGPVSGAESTPLPDFELEGFGDGAPPVRPTELLGAPLVVNFWATWCAPCVAEMPDLQRTSEETAGRVTFLGVSYRDPDRDAARAFVDELGITYPLAADPSGAFLAEVGGFGMPTTLLVDPDGTIVYRHTGLLDAEQLRGLLDRYLDVDV